MEDLLEGLNEAQREAVTHERGPLLIVAGAGTGKTTVLTRRYVWLLKQQGLKADQIAALTFTEKASEEMEDRVLQLLPNGTYDFWISTFHRFCQRLLGEHALEIGLSHRFNVVDETAAWLLMKRHLHELPLDHYRPLGNPTKFLASLQSHFSRAKDEGILPEEYLEFAKNAVLDGDGEVVNGERKRLQEIADCYFAYRKMMRELGALDFGDLLVETLRLLKERPAVLQKLRQRFRVILVDEFQDTNWAQYELVKLLAGDARNITVVGDDDQAIYKFRGASLANILQFRDDYPDAKTVALTDNYRSCQGILDVAYGFISKNNPNRLETRLATTGLSKKLLSHREGDARVQASWFRSLDEEAENVAERIRLLKERDPELRWNDIAILVRSNDGALPFVQMLERKGIPFQFFALRGLYTKPTIIDVMSVLSVCAGTQESATVWRTLSINAFHFTAHDMAELVNAAHRKGYSVWHVMKRPEDQRGLSDEGRTRVAKLVGVIERLSETARRERPLKVYQEALTHTGYLQYILKLPEQEKTEQLANLNGFADRIKRYEQSTHDATLKGFLDELRLEIESGEEGALDMDPSAGPEMVRVMTIHASKGLEFRHVFIVSLVDQRFPTRERSEAIPLPDGLVRERLPEGDAHLEEERRLMYVALTRAKETVTLTGASSYGGTRKKKPSMFVEEAGVDWEIEAGGDDDVRALTAHQAITEKEKSEREAFPLKRRFSFTQLAAFKNCPLQYKFAHVYRIPVLGGENKTYGQNMHRTLHRILEQHRMRGAAQQGSLFVAAHPGGTTGGFHVSIDEALEIFESEWVDEWFESRDSHDKRKKLGRDTIRRMVAEWTEQPPNVFALEQSFDWRVADDLSLKGSVDRIDVLPTGGHIIYDYKTGEPKTPETIRSDQKEQLRLYQIAMEQRGIDVRELAYIYLNTGDVCRVDILQGDKREAFIQDLEERMREILSSSFLATPQSRTCANCDFRLMCEARKL